MRLCPPLLLLLLMRYLHPLSYLSLVPIWIPPLNHLLEIFAPPAHVHLIPTTLVMIVTIIDIHIMKIHDDEERHSFSHNSYGNTPRHSLPLDSPPPCPAEMQYYCCIDVICMCLAEIPSLRTDIPIPPPPRIPPCPLPPLLCYVMFSPWMR